MIEKSKINLCAENIVKCVNVKEGECVYIKGGIYCQELLEEIALNVLRKGGLPHLTSSSDNYAKTIYQDDKIKIKTLEKTPMHVLKMIENIDIYIVIEPYEDPSIQNKFPRDKLFASSKASAPIKDILYGGKKEYEPGKKWCYASFPSQKSASYYNIDYNLYEEFIIDGMCVPIEDLIKNTSYLKDRLNNANKVFIKDDNGTDFWISIRDRRINIDSGIISDEMIAIGDLGSNLPAGEVFVAPQEKVGDGRLFCPLTIDRNSGKILKNIDLTFKNGKLLIDKVTADNNLEDLVQSFTQCEHVDKEKKVKELRTYNIAELGIGCNPKITKAIGYILTDEKIKGSVHLAFGDNKQMGGTSISQMHWDFVTVPKVNITVEYLDGTKKIVMESGKLIE
ncbi:MAG TPA: aminopeptidase [Candidatus Lokiarchaeia archaeon]